MLRFDFTVDPAKTNELDSAVAGGLRVYSNLEVTCVIPAVWNSVSTFLLCGIRCRVTLTELWSVVGVESPSIRLTAGMHDIMARSMDYRNLLYLTSKPAMETLDDMSQRALAGPWSSDSALLFYDGGVFRTQWMHARTQ